MTPPEITPEGLSLWFCDDAGVVYRIDHPNWPASDLQERERLLLLALLELATSRLTGAATPKAGGA